MPAALTVLALALLVGAADTSADFAPTLEVTIENPEPEASSDFSTSFDLPEGDVNFAAVVAFIPGDWGLVPGLASR